MVYSNKIYIIKRVIWYEGIFHFGLAADLLEGSYVTVVARHYEFDSGVTRLPNRFNNRVELCATTLTTLAAAQEVEEI